MRRIACLVFFVGIVGLLSGCTSLQRRGYVNAGVTAANYSNDYIRDFRILNESGEPAGVGGAQVLEFSKGGLGGQECCAPIPGVGQTINVVWRVGARGERQATWKTFSRSVVVRGVTSNVSGTVNLLIVRFFPDHDAEAEFVVESAKPDDETSPRVDQLFYGRRVMRQKGE
jgi:hypothetical protein